MRGLFSRESSVSHSDDAEYARSEIQHFLKQARAAWREGAASIDEWGDYDEAITALHLRGDRATLDAVRPLLDADAVRDRVIAAHALGQLGVPERTFPGLCFEALAGRVKVEDDPAVLSAIGDALSHLDLPGAVDVVLPLVKHADHRARFGAVAALSRQDDPRAIAALIELSADPDAEVRNWATFGLGVQTDADTPALRAALKARLDDPELDGEIRGEALVGLAERGDTGIAPYLARSLTQLDPLAVKAAALIADPSLHAPLLALRDHGDMTPHFRETLDEAIARCDPDAEV